MAEIETTGSWSDNTKSFRTTCSCGGHSVDIWIEKDINVLYLMFNSNIGYWENWESPFYKRYWERIKRAASLLFLGRIEHEESFTFRSDNHIKEFVETLINARNEFVSNKDDKWIFKIGDNKNEYY